MTNKAALLKKYGSEEAIREHYREMQRKSMLNPSKQKGTYIGPFNRLSKEELQEISRKGVLARQKKAKPDEVARLGVQEGDGL